MPVVVAFVVGLAAVLIWGAMFVRSSVILRRWAERNRYTILEARVRFLRRGPFWWRSTDKQMVFRVAVEDEQGNVRRGYVRCGGLLFGLFSDRADVEWDD